ncbi:receptor kinase-like protein Xa21 [Cornus florida]|uniref:receptor kinase-like protein Xa21 n=1 Tax=Cornus florida TaxID=4283 RepID=UPI00289DA9F0|nr:receptor kinase-like protein Xa21 [Cornus florida]
MSLSRFERILVLTFRMRFNSNSHCVRLNSALHVPSLEFTLTLWQPIDNIQQIRVLFFIYTLLSPLRAFPSSAIIPPLSLTHAHYFILSHTHKHQIEEIFWLLQIGELLQATDKFSPAKVVGEGRYGCVYKGVLNSFGDVAVKVLKLQRRGASKSFVAECEALRNTRHRNLVKIFTAYSGCDHKGNEFKALVFDFMPNGSLERWLHPSSSVQFNSRNLNLIQRLNIAIDVACALDYLHNRCTPPIIHCDLKPNNILLGNELCAHVGDFGLARFLDYMQSNSSIGVRGTIGYVAPEYGTGGNATTQGDVYSYGILLLEMFTQKKPTDSMFMDNLNLHNYVKIALPDRVMEVVDPLLILEAEYESNRTGQSSKGNQGRIEKCLGLILRIGVVCSAELPRERKGIGDVLAQLNVIRNYFLASE